MARRSFAHISRKSGPGTGGPKLGSDLAICADKKETGATEYCAGEKYGLSREMIRHIINTGRSE